MKSSFYSCGKNCTENGSPLPIINNNNNNDINNNNIENESDDDNDDDKYYFEDKDQNNKSLRILNQKLKLLGLNQIPLTYNSTHLKSGSNFYFIELFIYLSK